LRRRRGELVAADNRGGAHGGGRPVGAKDTRPRTRTPKTN
jgi:hypothetical protein